MNFQPPIFPPSRKNEFKPGDIVIHPTSGRKGEVTHVWKKWVRFKVAGETAPCGRGLYVRHPYFKLRHLVTRRERAADALYNLAAQIQTPAAPKPTLWHKIKAKIGGFLSRK